MVFVFFSQLCRRNIAYIGGIYGEIVELDDEKVKVQVSEKVELTFARSAIANVLSKKNKEEK